MNFLIILLLVVLVVGVFASALMSVVDFILSVLGWGVVIGLIIGGVLMLKAGLGLVAGIPILLGLALINQA